jgi:dCMP deaminase
MVHSQLPLAEVIHKPCVLEKASFDATCMEMAQQLALHSHCVMQQVGAVIANNNTVIATGYNSPPHPIPPCDEAYPSKDCMRDLRGGCFFSLHAEQNAIFHALRRQQCLDQSTLYITLTPCLSCAKLILAAGIIRLVYLYSYAAYKGLPFEEGLLFLEKFDVAVEQYLPPPKNC